ncbi:uncharacterized protein LOC123679743 isoform X1 [Harmonia axyridis]|uniref:uncharacterized protein LOC123679743 isoform X1 n=1 Tax=Harmonia axyridis TaxID=115357 RepID=UPI001E275C32|nr:uncharacterized protein LOC123679743 isoform X1 [Harmonia axyridis]
MANVDITRSEYIIKRLMLLQTMEAPTISDAKKNFGDDFAQKIFCNCDPNFKEDFGLEPPLKGPIGGDLWTSPSDLLIGKVCLKPPLTSKHIRALTHQGIMDIGSKIEKLFWNQVEIEKSKEMEEQDRTLRLLCETSKKEAIAEVQARMLEVFKRQRLELINEMDDLCKKEMSHMEIKYHLDLQEELKDQALYLEQQFQLKLEEEVSRISEIMTVHSSVNLEELEMSMKKLFQTQIQKAEIHALFEIQKERSNCREKLRALQHDLECKNLANMMYLICMERKKCSHEKAFAENQLTQEISELSSILRSKDEEIARITAERDKHKKEVELREKALLEMIREFQKFINFALKSVPKQAEYLLCAEKLMVFELTEALAKVEVPKGREYDYDRNYLWDKTPERSESSGGSLKVKDGHDCLNQPEISESELSLEQFLPGFYYNDQLFVREDFRDMISQGLTIKENNMLWTKHVQDVMDHLSQPCQSCMFNDKKDNDHGSRIVEKKKSLISYQSSVHFSMKEKDKTSMLSVEKDKKYKRASLKPIEPEEILQTINFSHIGSEENRKTLISAKNSLEVLKDSITRRRSSTKSDDIIRSKLPEMEVLTVDDISEEKEITQGNESKLYLETRDSVIKTKIEQMIGSGTDVKSLVETVVEPKKITSKITMTTDSVEVIKKRESVLPKKKLQEDTLCEIQKCDGLKFEDSTEETITKVSRPRDMFDTDIETPRRISIAFTGRSVIYEKDEDDDESETKEAIRKVKKRKQHVKSKKTKPTKQHGPKKISSIKDKPENTQLTKVSTDLEEKHKETDTLKKVVMGDSNMEFFNQTDKQFTSDRILSFVNILKNHPNLIRLFTSVTR